MNQAWLVIGWKGQGIRKLASMFFAWLARYIVLPPIKKKKIKKNKGGKVDLKEKDGKSSFPQCDSQGPRGNLDDIV